MHPGVYQNWNLHAKQKYFWIWDQKYFIWLFLGCNFKTILPYFKLMLPNSSICKVSIKTKTLWIKDQKCLIWVFLPCNLKTKLLPFLTLTLSDSSKYKFLSKTRNFQFRTKNVLFGYFYPVIWKQNYCHFGN